MFRLAALLSLLFPLTAHHRPPQHHPHPRRRPRHQRPRLLRPARPQHPAHLDRLAQQGMRFTASDRAATDLRFPSRAALRWESPARLHLTTYLPAGLTLLLASASSADAQPPAVGGTDPGRGAARGGLRHRLRRQMAPRRAARLRPRSAGLRFCFPPRPHGPLRHRGRQGRVCSHGPGPDAS